MHIVNPFNVKKSDIKLSKEDLIRSIRSMISAEFEAIQLYTQLADSIDDEKIIKQLNDIADEEKKHVGEFLSILMYLDPREKPLYKQGMKEFEI